MCNSKNTARSACCSEAENQPLGIKTKSSSGSNRPKMRENRRQRYDLVNTARKIFAYAGKRDGLEYVLNYHKTAKCKHIMVRDGVHVMKSTEHDSAFYAGLVVCGRIWTCPVCGALIQERRREEVSTAMEHFRGQRNKQAAMITLTFSHKFGDDLEDLLEKQTKALEKLRSGDVWQSFKEVFGFDGLIRSLELTFGDNGYHPHTHELWFIDQNVNRKRLDAYLKAKFRAKKHHAKRDRLLGMTPRAVFKELLIDRWEMCCEKVGLIDPAKRDAFRTHSVDVKFNARNSDYLAKQDSSSHWGADRELAKATSKQGKKKGVHPFMFLEKFKETGDTIWSHRWLQYSKAMHNKRQMYWSAGLKERVGLLDKSDEEIAVEEEDQAIQVAVLNKQQWRKVANNELQWLVLDVAEEATGEAVLAVVDNMPEAETVEKSVEHVEVKPPERYQLTGEELDEVTDSFKKTMKTKDEYIPPKIEPTMARKYSEFSWALKK
ncbi:protein rep [Vibrio splendidus]